MTLLWLMFYQSKVPFAVYVCLGPCTPVYPWEYHAQLALHNFEPTSCWIYHGYTHKVNLCSVLALEAVWSNEVHIIASQGLVMASLEGSFPYLCFRRLFT